MCTMLGLCILVFVVSLPYSTGHNGNHGSEDHDETVPLLVISVDSFRWNFVERLRRLKKDTPADVRSRLWELVEKGAYARDGITPIFPSLTYPSQHTLVTGLYPESHGVVSDAVYDPIVNRTADLKPRKAEYGWVFEGEPIWKTLESRLNREKRRKAVGCYMWAGCEHSEVTTSVPFRWNTIWHDRVDKAVEWLKEGVRLILVSSPDLDSIGRTDGPDSESMDQALIRFDADIAYLWKRLQDEKLIDRLNLVIVSGHGITKALSEHPLLPLTPPQDSVVRSKTPTMWLVQPAEGGENETVAYFKQFEHLRVYAKKDVPVEWHFRNSRRIPPIVVVAEPGYILSEATDRYHKGLYGYNSSVSDMRGTLIGYGPAFLSNSSIPPSFHTIDVYHLLCLLLNLSPAPNNGSTKHFASFVQPSYLARLPPGSGEVSFPVIPVTVLSVILVLGILIGTILCYRSGECPGQRRQAEPGTRTVTVDSMVPGEKTPIMHKYDSELVILELDDGAVATVNA